MARLIPLDYDPFGDDAGGGAGQLIPLDFDPFEEETAAATAMGARAGRGLDAALAVDRESGWSSRNRAPAAGTESGLTSKREEARQPERETGLSPNRRREAEPIRPQDFDSRLDNRRRDGAPSERELFEAWKRDAERRGINTSTEDYDLQGWWKGGALGQDGDNGHFPDTYKKPNHITFSDESQYSSPKHQGGHWSKSADGRDVFTPGPENLKRYTPEQMREYFAKNEPDAILNLDRPLEEIGQNIIEVGKGIPGGAVTATGSALQGVAAVAGGQGLDEESYFQLRAAAAGRLTQAQRDQMRRDAYKRLGGDGPDGTRDPSRGNEFSRLMNDIEGELDDDGLAGRGGDGARALTVLDGLKPTGIKDSDLYRAGADITKFGNTIFPAAPGYEDSVGRQVGKGLGSMVPGSIATVVAGPAGGGTVFAAQGAGEAADRALLAGATDEQAADAAKLGALVGTTNVLPVETLLGKMPLPFRETIAKAITKYGAGPITQAAARVGEQAFVEGLQEGGEQYLQNLIAREIYRPDQDLTEGVLPSAGIGGGTGGVAQGLMETGRLALRGFAGRRGGAPQAASITPPSPDDEASPIDTALIQQGKQRIANAQAGIPAPAAPQIKEPPKVEPRATATEPSPLDAIIGEQPATPAAEPPAATAETWEPLYKDGTDEVVGEFNSATGDVRLVSAEPAAVDSTTEAPAAEETTQVPRETSSEVAVDDELLASAAAETAAAKQRDDLDADAAGVIIGRPRALDQAVNAGRYTLEDVAGDFSKTRDLLRQRYGDSVTLYRADAPEAERSAETRTVLMGDKALAERFATNGRAAEPVSVKVDDIVAVYARPSGYYEFVVRKADAQISIGGGGSAVRSTALPADADLLKDFPPGYRLQEGRGQLGKGRWAVVDDAGKSVWNYEATKEEAVNGARSRMADIAAFNERNAQKTAREQAIATRIRGGEQATDDDLAALDLKGKSRFDYISPVVQRVFGISSRKVREAMGDALRLEPNGMNSAEYWYANTRKALANAAAWAERNGVRPQDGGGPTTAAAPSVEQGGAVEQNAAKPIADLTAEDVRARFAAAKTQDEYDDTRVELWNARPDLHNDIIAAMDAVPRPLDAVDPQAEAETASRQAASAQKAQQVADYIATGGRVTLVTNRGDLGRAATKLTNPEQVRVGKDGLYIARGRNWDYLTEQQLNSLIAQVPASRRTQATQPAATAAADQFDPAAYISQARAYVASGKPIKTPAVAKAMGLTEQQASRVMYALGAQKDSGLRVTKAGEFRRVPTRKGPVDAVTFLAERGGIRDDEGHDLKRGRNLQRMVPGSGPLIRQNGMSVDAAGEALWEAGYFGQSAERPTEDQVLQLLERTAGGKKVYVPEEGAEVQAAQQQARDAETDADRKAQVRKVEQKHKLLLTDKERGEIVERLAADPDLDAEEFTIDYIEAAAIRALNDLERDTSDESYDSDDFEIPFGPEEGAGSPEARIDGQTRDTRDAPEGDEGREPVGQDRTETVDTVDGKREQGRLFSGSEDRATAPKIQPKAKQQGADEGLFGKPQGPEPETTGMFDEKPDAKPQAEQQSGRIEDFGEKIEGARKDAARVMTEALADEDVDLAVEPMSKTFPQPDYEKLAAEGVSSRAMAYVALLRDVIPPKPRKSYKVARWAENLKIMRQFARQLLDGSIPMETLEQRMRASIPSIRAMVDTAQVLERIAPDRLQQAAKWRIISGRYSVLNGQRFDTPQTRYVLLDDRQRYTKLEAASIDEMADAAVEQINEHIDRLASAEPKARKTPLKVYQDRHSKDLFIGFKGAKEVVRLKTGFATGKEAFDYIAEHEEELQQKVAELRAGPNERRATNEPRVGPARREGDVSPELFAETFGFRGVQFGNYVEGARRQEDLNEAFDGLMDLADLIGVPPRALSLNGTLGLAFGARGKGGRAMAHYEAGQIVINLTKTKGAGALAHEWFHALDNYFEKQDAGREGPHRAYMSERFRKQGEGASRQEIYDAWRGVTAAISKGGFSARAAMQDAARSKPYWSTTLEKAARAFEMYAYLRLKADGASNDYLVNIDTVSGAYPTEAEMRTDGITEAYDNLFRVMEAREADDGNVPLFKKPGAEALTADFIDAREAAYADFRSEMDRVGLGKVDLRVENSIFSNGKGISFSQRPGEDAIDGFFWRNTIGVALDSAKGAQWTLRHEIIHGLRSARLWNSDYGLFRKAEWDTLERDRMAEIKRRYADLTEAQQVEEAIADMYADWNAGRMEARGFIRTAFERIKAFLEALGNALRGNGFQTAADVFQRIADGEFANRADGDTGLDGEPVFVRRQRRGQDLLRVSQTTAEWMGFDRIDVIANFDQLQRRHPEHYADPEQVRADVEYVLEKPDNWYPYADGRVMIFRESKGLAPALRLEMAKGEDGALRIISVYRMPRRQALTQMRDMKQKWMEGRRSASATRSSPTVSEYLGEVGLLSPPSDGVRRPDENIDPATPEGNDPLFSRPQTGNLFNTSYGAPQRSVAEELFSGARGLLGNLNAATSRTALGESFDRWRFNFQDRFIDLKDVQRDISRILGRDLAAKEDPYLQEELMTGRIGARMDTLAEDMVAPLVQGIADNLDQLSVNITRPRGPAVTMSGLELLEEYLYARHAPERNRRIAQINPDFQPGEGSGMTDAEAQRVIDDIRTAGALPAVEAVAAQVDRILDFSVRTRVAAGLLSQEQADAWRAQYRHYVPLRGFAELDPELADERPNLGGTGLTVKGPESKRALGRQSRAADIVAHSVVMAQEAIIRAERNEVGKALFNLVAQAPNPDFWEANKVEMRAVWDEKAQQVAYRPVTPVFGADANYTVTLKIDGKEHRITFNRENAKARRLADSMRNLSGQDFAFIVATLGKVNRFLSAVNTSYNPEFVITNAFRDAQTGLINLGQYDVPGLIRGTVRDYPAALKGSIKGAFGKGSGDWRRWYDEFVSAGGRVYYNQTDSVQEMQKRLLRDLKDAQSGPTVMKALRSAARFIENANQGVEGAIRLAAYKNAREAGVPVERAASLAKNLTVNFNRRGKYGPVMNSLYLFYNASIQGSATMLMAMRSRRVQKVLASAVALGASLTVYNLMAGGDDDDGERHYDKISDFDKERNLIIMSPDGSGKYFKIPLPYGYNVFPGIGRTMVEIIGGRDATEAGGSLATTIVDAFNPVGGTETLLNLVAPTIVDPLVDLYGNRDYAGQKIAREREKGDNSTPNAQLYWNSVRPVWKSVTEFLTEISGGDDVTAGAIDINPEHLEYLFGVVTGAAGGFIDRNLSLAQKMFDPTSDVTMNDFSFARKLVGGENARYDRDAFYERANRIDNVAERIKKYRSTGRAEQANNLRRENAGILRLERRAKTSMDRLADIRKQRARAVLMHEQGKMDRDAYRTRVESLKEREKRIYRDFNTAWIRIEDSEE